MGLLFLAVVLPALAQESVLPANPLSAFSLQRPDSSFAVSSLVSVTGQPFTQALRVRTIKRPANPWNIQLNVRTARAVARGDVLHARFSLRRFAPADGEAYATFIFEKASPDYDKSAQRTFTESTGQWRQFHVAFVAAADYAAGAAQVNFQLGFDPQTVELGGMTITNYAQTVALGDLPDDFTYAGREADAPWRAAAAERIGQLRQAALEVTVRGPDGQPLPGATVQARMRRHAFKFGSAVAGSRLLGSGTNTANYRRVITNWYNRVVIENDLKWPGWEANPSLARNAVTWLTTRGLEVRGHNLIWPAWRWMPADTQALAGQPDALRARINGHFTNILTAMKGRLVDWDVINEPFTERDVMNVLGDAEMAAWLGQARALDPAAQLYVNDYGNLEEVGLNSPHLNGFLDILRFLRGRGAPLDGIGLQGHFTGYLSSPAQVLGVFDKFAEFGLPLQVTEFDVDTRAEAVQADYTRDFLTAAFSHPAVNGVLTWGFWEGQHWRPDAAFFRRDWSLKPAGEAWSNLVLRAWWTDTNLVASADGRVALRGFKGEYDLTVKTQGVEASQPLTLEQDTQVTVTLTNLPPSLKIERQEGAVRLSWPQTGAAFRVEQSPALPAVAWLPAGGAPTTDQGTNRVTIAAGPPEAFFRLSAE